MDKKEMKTLSVRMAANPDDASQVDMDIFSDIGDSYYEGFTSAKASDLLKSPSVKTVNVRINSYGGDAYDGVSIYNLLKGSGKEINVKITGIAASAASIIAMAGDKITMYPSSQMMIHNAWTWTCGNAKELRKAADYLDKLMDGMKTAYLDKAGDKLDAKQLTELLDAESYLSAGECLAYGLCDEIEEKKPEPEEDPDQEEETEEADAKAEAEPVKNEIQKPEPEEMELWF